jgi:hypothetical protein
VAIILNYQNFNDFTPSDFEDREKFIVYNKRGAVFLAIWNEGLKSFFDQKGKLILYVTWWFKPPTPLLLETNYNQNI